MTIWTLLVFGLSMWSCSQVGFPEHRGGARPTSAAIEDSIDAAVRTARRPTQLLAEYRERLKEARRQAEEIVERARKRPRRTSTTPRSTAEARREQLLEQTRRDIEAETRRVVDEICARWPTSR